MHLNYNKRKQQQQNIESLVQLKTFKLTYTQKLYLTLPTDAVLTRK